MKEKYNEMYKKIYRYCFNKKLAKIEDLENNIFTEIFVNKDKAEDDYILFINNDYIFAMFHEQNCCESVTIKEISGDITDLEHYPLLMAELVKNDGNQEWGTFTWSFYKLATIKGYVTISWFGESNGYYSEEVSIYKINRKELEKEINNI
jgi:hypothetical protein